MRPSPNYFSYSFFNVVLLSRAVELTAAVGNKEFPVAAPKIWNSLPYDIVSSANLSTFCRQLGFFCSVFCFLI